MTSLKRMVAEKWVRYISRRNAWISRRPRILIFCSEHYTTSRWQSSIGGCLDELAVAFDFRFTQNRLEFAALLEGADACFCYGITRHVDLSCSNLKFIYFGVSGLEFTESLAIPAHIKIFSPLGISSTAIADHILMVALMLLNNFQIASENKVKKRWDQNGLISGKHRPLKEQTVGILGVGRNGRAAASRFRALGCEVLGFDKMPDSDNEDISEWFAFDELDTMFAASDILVICLPLTAETRGLINIDLLRKLGRESFLVNTARGEIVVEEDLLLALQRGDIKGAAVDTLKQEPLPRSSQFWRLPNFIISPHVFGNVNNFVEEIQADFLSHVKLLTPYQRAESSDENQKVESITQGSDKGEDYEQVSANG